MLLKAWLVKPTFLFSGRALNIVVVEASCNSTSLLLPGIRNRENNVYRQLFTFFSFLLSIPEGLFPWGRVIPWPLCSSSRSKVGLLWNGYLQPTQSRIAITMLFLRRKQKKSVKYGYIWHKRCPAKKIQNYLAVYWGLNSGIEGNNYRILLQ